MPHFNTWLFMKMINSVRKVVPLLWAFSILNPACSGEGTRNQFPLWDTSKPIPRANEIELLKGVEFHVIKRYEPQNDGYRFLHGVALVWHNERIFASFGHNQGGENTNTEQARFCVSSDGGKNWSKVRTIDDGSEENLGVSHGVFVVHNGQLWAFHGSYNGTLKNVKTRAYRYDDSRDSWLPKGVVVEDGFWPMQEPQRMPNGNWVMSGFCAGNGNPAAVAISDQDDLMKWKLVKIPPVANGKMWGESTILSRGTNLLNVARYGDQAIALTAESFDSGQTWTRSQPSNLPMVTSKPYGGTLSCGLDYLIATTTADSGKRRSPLTIAIRYPNDSSFSRLFVIRPALFPQGPGESHDKAALAYPYAVEHNDKLYVGYSNSGGNAGRVGTGRELWNNNSAELAIIPIDALNKKQ